MTALRTRHPWPGFRARFMSFPNIIPNGGHSPFIPSSPSVCHPRPHFCPRRGRAWGNWGRFTRVRVSVAIME